MLLSRNKGFTLVELMIAMAIGVLLVLAAMTLYVPISRSLIDQGAISQQTMSEAINYDFDVMNTANAGYGIGTLTGPPPTATAATTAVLNTDLVLVTGGGVGSNVAVTVPPSSSAQGNGVFWDWESPPGGTPACAGLQIIPSTTASGNDRLVYYQEVSGGTCTNALSAINAQGNWNVVTVIPSIATTNATPITVTTNQNCDLRGSQFVNNPVLHPLMSLQLPIAATLTGGFFAHTQDIAPTTVCLRNLP